MKAGWPDAASLPCENIGLLRPLAENASEKAIAAEIAEAENSNSPVQACLNFAASQVFKSRTEDRVAYLSKSLDLARLQGFVQMEARLLDKLGDNAVETLDYGQALEYYEKALALNEEYDRHALKPPSYSRIGIVYYNLGDGDRAIEYYETGLEILEKYDPSDMSIKGTLLANVGEAHVKEGRAEEAIYFLELGKEVYAKSGQQRSLAFLDRRHAEAFYTLGQSQQALKMAEKSARGFLESDLDTEAGATLSWLAARYLEMGNFDEAEVTLKRAQQLVDPENRGPSYLLTLETSAFWRMDYARGMAQMLARLGKADEAWLYSEMALELSEQRFESDRLERLANADVLIKLRDRDRDVEFMRQEALVSDLRLDQSQSRMILSALAAVIALLLSILLFWFYRTQRKLAHTKDVFLSEIHHRTKNNLQVLSSLLSLDARRSRHADKSKVATQDAANRARTMALVHDHIYHHELGEDRQTDLNAFVQDLLKLLEESLGRKEISLTGKFNAPPVDVDRVTPLGLIVAELVSNAFKYAFDDGKGVIDVTLSNDNGNLLLLVNDDGAGFEPELAMRKSGSLGLSLVHDLASQIEANIEVTSGERGTSWRLILDPRPGH